MNVVEAKQKCFKNIKKDLLELCKKYGINPAMLTNCHEDRIGIDSVIKDAYSMCGESDYKEYKLVPFNENTNQLYFENDYGVIFASIEIHVYPNIELQLPRTFRVDIFVKK